jgi:hypothetical protein
MQIDFEPQKTSKTMERPESGSASDKLAVTYQARITWEQ